MQLFIKVFKPALGLERGKRHDGAREEANGLRRHTPMIEHIKPVSDKITHTLSRHPARLKRELALKEKVGTIIKEHPNKSVSVIRRWLHSDQK